MPCWRKAPTSIWVPCLSIPLLELVHRLVLYNPLLSRRVDHRAGWGDSSFLSSNENNPLPPCRCICPRVKGLAAPACGHTWQKHTFELAEVCQIQGVSRAWVSWTLKAVGRFPTKFWFAEKLPTNPKCELCSSKLRKIIIIKIAWSYLVCNCRSVTVICSKQIFSFVKVLEQ